MKRQSIAVEARLRRKLLLTLPEPIVEAAHLKVGDRFVVELEPDDTDTIRLHRVRESYAGALHNVYGDATAYLDAERASWERGG